MPTLNDRLKQLQGEPEAAIVAFAGSALAWAEPDEREALFEVATARPDPRAQAAAIGVLHELGPAALATLVESRTHLGPAFRLLRGRRPVLNAMAVARRRSDTALLEHLVGWIDFDDHEVPRRAAETLRAIVVAHAGPDGRRRLRPADAGRIDQAVARAAAKPAARHLDDVALAAAILTTRPGPCLSAVLGRNGSRDPRPHHHYGARS